MQRGKIKRYDVKDLDLCCNSWRRTSGRS